MKGSADPGGVAGTARVVSLPLLDPAGSGGGSAASRAGRGVRPRKSKRAGWRAAVLIGVHVAMAAHIAHWLIVGETVAPVEPSESMQTLELGLVNAGFIFFAAAILSTLVFGRFMCGWGCHIVALQDLCAWMMGKIGVRPKPFRSRLLVLIPVGLAAYMFVWPSFKRLVLFPALDAVPEGSWLHGMSSWWLSWLRPPASWPVDGATLHLVVEDFWATFPGPLVAVPFLLICGFASVYFLGAKGFCTYGCPYGGIFGPVDRLSPGRIVVDHDRCDGNAHCTAVCTSNVRVHEEIARYGMVVDPGCMKCMDCVSVCPSNALSFRFATPAAFVGAGREPKNSNARRAGKGPLYDTSIGEDLGLLVVFVLVFVAVRGMYDLVPMLMAMGIAGVATFLAFKAWQTLRMANARFRGWQFRRAGRLTPGGVGYLALCGVLGLLVAHGGVMNWFLWSGDRVHDRLPFNPASLFSPAPPAVDDALRERAASAARSYQRLRPVWAGGIGLAVNPAAELRLASMLVIVGDRDGAIESLRRVLARQPRSEAVALRLASVLIDSERHEEALAVHAGLLERVPWAAVGMQDLVGLAQSMGRAAEAEAQVESALARIPSQRKHDDARSTAHELLGHIAARRGDGALAMRRYREATEADPTRAAAHESLAAGLLNIERDVDGAVSSLERAVLLEPENPARWMRLLQLVGSARGPDAGRAAGARAIEALEAARDARPWRGELWLNLARMQATMGELDASIATIEAGLAAPLRTPMPRPALVEFATRLGRADLAQRWSTE